MDPSRLGTVAETDDAAEQLLELVLETGDVVGATLDTDLRHTWVYNPNPEPSEAEILEKRDDELYPREDVEPTIGVKRAALERDERVEREFVFQKPWGPVAYRVAAEPLYDEGGSAEGVLFAAFDRSGRYRLLDRITDAAYTVDRDWCVTFWNDVMAERTGIEPAEILGRSLWETFGEGIPDELAVAYREAMASGAPVELTQYVGEQFDYWVEVRAFPDEDGMTVFSREVTEEVNRTRELERHDLLFDRVQHIADIGVWEYDLRTETLWWSPGVYRIHGLDPNGQPSVDEALEFYHPEDRERVNEALDRAAADGTRYDLVVRLLVSDGSVRDVRARGEGVVEGDEVVLLQGTIQDVTEVKRTERQLRQQNERLSEFADVLAHDIRNPLSVAAGFTDIAIQSEDPSALPQVRTALERIEALVEDMLTAARVGAELTETNPVDLPGLARAAWENVPTESTTVVVDADLGTVEGDYTRLLRLFENLFRNSVEHGSKDRRDSPDDSVEHGSTDSGTPSGDSAEGTSARDRRPTDAEDCAEHGEADVVVRVGPLDGGFYVEDDGPGIAEADRERVFDRGYSTSELGTGFGLAIVEDVAAAHGWKVSVTEAQTGGARFEFAVREGRQN